MHEKSEITPKEARELWALDLEKYPNLQGRGRLVTKDGKFCCLGRLCVVAALHGVVLPEWWDEESGLDNPAFEDVRRWVGLRHHNGYFRDNHISNSLVYCNDGSLDYGIAQLGFHEIAKIIRSEPKGLFDD